MANEKNSGKTPDPATKPDNFDDVEDAFFASGDASSFWETADRSDLDEESQEAATAPQDIDPLDEPGEALSTAATILVEPEDEPANNDIEAPTETPISADTGSDDNEAPPIEESPILSNDAPQDTPGAPHTHAAPDPDATSFYNPASIHPEPELIADDETEIWSGTASELATLEATTILNEPDAEVAPAEELETAPASIGGDITAITYILPSSPEGRWQEMSVALEKAAGQAKGSQRAQLLCESARILLTRAGLWEDAGQRFDAAIEAGLASSDAPKGYADVVASHGRFEDLRDILVGRGNSLKGSAAAEALQDAALVERNNLKNDSAAVQLLDQALDIRNDWFTLRLLREAHYRSKSWEDLVVVLRKMASMSTGSRSARCHVEAGRIIETELQDATAAAEEYDAALTQAPDFLDGFLARARVAGSVKDWSALSALYAAESKRTTGANAAFWMSRAARVSRDGGEDEGITADLYQQAINMCDRTLLSVHREAQAWFIETNRTEELFSALKQEAELLEGAARAATLLTLGQYQAATKDGQTSAIENLAKAVEADPSCSPAADAACGILIANDRAKEALEILENQEKGSQDAQSAAQITFRMAEITEVSLGDFAKAAKLYARAWEHDPEHPFAAAGQIRCLLETGGFETAVAIMEARTQTFGDDQRASRVWFQIGVVYRDRLNNQQSAQAAFQRAIDLSPTQPAAIDAGLALIDSADHKSLGGGLALASQHLPNTKDKLEASYRAAQVYLDGCGDMAASKTLLHRCLELDPTCGPAVSLLRKVANQTGDWQAVYDLRRIEAGSATNAEERRWHLLAAAEATTHIDGIDPQTVALEVLDEDKTHPGALAVLERAAIQRRDSHRLIGVYRKMRNLTQDPAEETGIAVRLVDLSQDVGNDQLTLQCINKVLEAPSGVRPYGALARIAVSLESWSLAEAALHADGDTIGMARLFESTNDDHRRVADTWRSVLKKSPNDVEAQAGLERALSRLGTREGLADIHASLANTEPAENIACMHAILAGHLYEHQDALDNAVEFYSKAFAANPFRGKAFDALVRIHSERRDAKTVRELFDKVGNTDTLALAYALEDAADTAGAATLYKAALDGFTPDANAAEVLPTLLRYEYALTTDERWTEVFDLLETRLHHTQDPHERALVEAKRRWILAERMADSDEAWDFYRKLHEEQPEDRDVLEALARIAGARGESDLAIQFLDGLANIAPTADDAARYQRRVAEVHLAGNNSDEARQSFLRALDHLPGDMEALTGLKEISKEAEDWQGYVGIIAREIHLLDGESKIARAREAAEVWETKLEDLEVASDAWRKVLELVPGDQTALQHLVNLGKQQKDWGGFIDHGKALVHYLDGEERAELLGQMGHAAYQYLRREEEAIRLLDEASLATPPNLQAAEILEQIHSGRGAWDLAVECLLRRARASEGETAAELFLRAARTRRDSLRDRKGASAIYAEALEHNPHEPEALQFQGEFLFENGDLKGAVAIFEQVESLDTDHDMDDFDVKMDLSLYYYRFGEALRRLSRTDDSLKRYEQALQLNNSHLPTLEAVGPLYVKLERWDDASRMFRQILQLTGGQGDPVRLARVYGNLGLVEHAQGNTEKAVRRFNKALELQPNDVPALRGYARVLYEKKDWNNLLTAYNNIIYHAKEREEFIHAYMMKGFVLDAHMALPDKAGQHYEKSLSFDASNPTALLRLAELALRKDDWDRASSFGGRALAVSNDSPDHVKALLHLVQGIATNKAGNEEGLAAGVSAAVGISSELAKLIEGSEDDIDSLQTIVRERLQEGL